MVARTIRTTASMPIVIRAKAGIGLKRTLEKDVESLLRLAEVISACGRSGHLDECAEHESTRTWSDPFVRAITFRTANGAAVYSFTRSEAHEHRPPLSFMTHRDVRGRSALKALNRKTLMTCADAARAAAAAMRYGIFVDKADLDTASLALCAPEMLSKAESEGRPEHRPTKTHVLHTCEAPFTKEHGGFRMMGVDGVFEPPAFPMALMLERDRTGAVGMNPIWNAHRLSDEPDAVTAMRAMSRIAESQERMRDAYRDLGIA